MKNIMMILTAITITFIVTVMIVIARFGSFNVTNHKDHYVTTCNGDVIDEHSEIVTDRVDFNININEGFNIFQR
jgi:hypothetical protein